MNLAKTPVNKPTTVLIILVLLMALGIYSSSNLAIDLFPDINPPILVVSTEYTNTGPEEVEKVITRPLESVLSNVGSIEKITSTSSEGSSMIILQFTWGTNMSDAANDVRDKIEYIKQYLPDDVTTPMIFKFDPSMMPIMYLSLKGNRSPEELREIGENVIQPRLEQVDGVAMAGVSGGREKLIRVEIPQNRLQAYNLTLTQVANMLRGQNINVSAGSLTEGNKNYLIRTTGEYSAIEEIKNTVVAYKGGNQNPMGDTGTATSIRLRDIANVYEGLKKEQEATYVNGMPAVQIIIQKQSGTNSVRTAEKVYKRLEKIQNELPQNISIEVIYDSTKMIKNSLADVTSSAYSGAFLAIIILFLFLRSFKSVLIIGLAIPISIVLTLFLMYFFKLTLNIMTLAGLILGIGMLVDNSIVILENIYRYREKGTKLTTAAIIGSQEMMNAIISSTLTTICVFAPMAMFKEQLGMYGELFSGLAFTVVFSLSSSLAVAIFIVPVFASKYLALETHLERNLTGIPKLIDDKLAHFLSKTEELYKNALRFVLTHRKLSVTIIAGIFIISLFLIRIVGFQLFPQGEEDTVTLSIELPVGTKLDETRNMIMQVDQIVKKEIIGYKDIVLSVGERGFMGFLGAAESNKGSIMVTLPKNRVNGGDSSTEIKNKLRKHFNDFPAVVFSFQSNMRMGGSSSPIDLLIKSNDFSRAREASYKIKDLLKEKVPEVTEPTVNLKEGLPQLEIFINREKAYSLGLNIYSIGQEIRANIDGIVASKFREGSNEYDIMVILDPKDRDEIPDLDKIFVLNTFGQRIPLSNLAHLEKTTGPINIRREQQMRTIHVTGGLAKKVKIENSETNSVKNDDKTNKMKIVKLNEVEAKIRNLIKTEIPQDDDLIIEFSGDYSDLLEYGLKLLIILIISIALVFGVMASQFESLLDPFIILFTIPLTFTGVIWIYLLTGEQLNMLTLVGLIVLVGIVVNNGIVLVDYTNLLVKRGYSLFEACIEAGKNRLRPILMTTLTTILGLIPMALVKVEGAELTRPLAKTILGGLTISTIFTLFLIPVIYSIFNQFSSRLKEKREIKRQEKMEIRKKKLELIKNKAK